MRIFKKLLRSRDKNIFSIDGKSVDLGKDYNLEAHLSRVVETYQINTILDVGANEGQFALRMRRMGFNGAIHSFEPVRQTYDKLLEQAAKDHLWKAHNIALGDAAGQLEINVSEASDLSSLLTPNEFGLKRFKRIRTTRKEQVKICRLDEFFLENISERGARVLLKIDTQGYDAQVFSGAQGIIKSVCGILSELSLIPLYDGMKDWMDMVRIYKSSGYLVSGIYPISRNKDDLSVIEMDCVMVAPAFLK